MKNSKRTITAQSSCTDTVAKVQLSLKDIRYGSLEMIIHDFRVVQVERKEKLRFHTPTPVAHP